MLDTAFLADTLRPRMAGHFGLRARPSIGEQVTPCLLRGQNVWSKFANAPSDKKTTGRSPVDLASQRKNGLLLKRSDMGRGSSMHCAVVDIGSPGKGNLGWWLYGPKWDVGGVGPDAMKAAFASCLREGPLVLGFEAPMYVPAKRALMRSLQARPGEGSRPWSGSAGATVAAISLAIVPSLLDFLHTEVSGARAWQDWNLMPSKPGEMLMFEAFVSGGRSSGHDVDAKQAAVEAYRLLTGTGEVLSCLGSEECFSLLGAALIHAGLSSDLAELKRLCLVVRAEKLWRDQ